MQISDWWQQTNLQMPSRIYQILLKHFYIKRFWYLINHFFHKKLILNMILRIVIYTHIYSYDLGFFKCQRCDILPLYIIICYTLELFMHIFLGGLFLNYQRDLKSPIDNSVWNNCSYFIERKGISVFSIITLFRNMQSSWFL